MTGRSSARVRSRRTRRTSGSATTAACRWCTRPVEEPPRSELAIRARKVRPGYAEGPLVRVAFARHQAEAEMIQGLLLEEGIPSLVRRSGGFDVPGLPRRRPARHPRRLLGRGRRARDPRRPPRRPPAPAERHPRVGARAGGDAGAIVVVTLRGRASPCRSSTKLFGEPSQVRAPGALGVPDRARERDLQRADRAVRVRAARERDARAVALLAREQVEDRAAEQQRVGADGREVGRRPSRSRRAIAGRTWRVCPESHCAAPSTSHAQRAQRASRPARRGGGSFGWLGGDVAAREQRRRARASASPASPRRSRRDGRAGAGRARGARAAGPADDVAPRRGRGQAARERQPRLRGVELGGRGVQDHRELPGRGVEALLQPRARELELREHARRVLLVALVVARDEGL